MLEADFSKFLVGFHAFCHFFEIYNVVKCDPGEADCLNNCLVLDPITEYAR